MPRLPSRLVARMILEQADDFMDVDRPGRERIRVRFHGDAARHPDVAPGLVELLMAAVDGNVYEAVTAYATGLGLGVTYYLGAEWVSIEINELLTLHPLVNASGGSPRSSASRHPRTPVARPLSRLLQPRAASGRSSARRRAGLAARPRQDA